MENKQTVQISLAMPINDTANVVWACIGNKEAQKNIFLEWWLWTTRPSNCQTGCFATQLTSFSLELLTFSQQLLPMGPLSASNIQRDSVGNFCPEGPNLSKMGWSAAPRISHPCRIWKFHCFIQPIFKNSAQTSGIRKGTIDVPSSKNFETE